MPDSNVLTYHNDISRTGAYLAETTLKPANVNVTTFGKLYERTIQGDIYAQPLYVQGVHTPRGTKNLFFIATSTNDLYAFDADDTNPDPYAGLIWHRNLNPWRPLVINNEICAETVGSVGVTSTPVIDIATQTLYVVTRRSGGTVVASNGNLYQLHNDGKIWHYTGTPLTGWQLLDNNPATTHIASTGASLYQLHRTGLIWRYTSPPLTGWQTLDNNPTSTQIITSGSDLYQVHEDGSIWQANDLGWQQLDNNAATVQIVASGPNLYQLHTDGTIWKYTGTPLTGWQLLDNNPATIEIAAAGSDLYQRHNTGLIWKYTGTPLTGWQLLDNNPATIEIAAAGSDLYQRHNTGLIWKYTGTPLTGWQLLDNNPATIEIVAAGSDLYQRHNTGLIWKYTGTPLTGWQLLDNNPATIEIAAAGSDLYQRHNTGLIWKYTGTPLTGWQLLDNNPATIEIAAAGSDLYQRHNTGKIWKYTGTPLAGWQLLDENSTTTHIIATDADLYQLHGDGTIWRFTGAPSWRLLDNNPATAHITASGGNLYQLHRTGLIWQYTGTPLTGWQLLDNNPATVQIVAAGPDLYQLHNTGLIWKYTGTPLTGWQLLDNNPATTRIAASPSGGGSALYQLHTDGTIWKYTGPPLTGWQLLDNNPTTAQVITDNLRDELYQIHIDGTIWKYTGPPLTGWLLLDNNWALNDGSNYLHAVNILDGSERRAPVRIEAIDSHGVRFDARCQRNRPGLLLLNGLVYLGFATFSCDAGSPDGHPYHGWILSYRDVDLTQVGVYCTSPDGSGAGVWQSGGGLVGSADGSIYFETGNANDSHTRLGDSFVRLQAIGSPLGLMEAGHYTVSNTATLRDGGPLSPAAAAWVHSPTGPGDTDLGSGGPMLLPGGRLIGGGKQGRYYVIDATSMRLSQNAALDADGFEGFQPFVNTWHPTFTHRDYEMGERFGPNIHSAPIYWSGPSFLYQMPEKDYLKAFHYDPAARTVQITPSVLASGSWARPRDGMPGGFSSLSANGDHDGIVWTCLPQQDGQWTKVPGVLVAFDARTLRQLWVDESPVPFAKFCPPTIAGGKVFRPTGASAVHHGVPGKVIVYGLLSARRPAPIMAAGAVTLATAAPVGPPAGDPVSLTIHDLYLSHGGPHGPIGQPVGDEQQHGNAIGGRHRDYRSTVRGNPMGLASMQADHAQSPATCHNPTQGAPVTLTSAIYWSPKTGAQVVGGEILTLWRKQGAEKGPLGYPTSGETNTADSSGRVSHFEHGDIVWYPGSGPAVRLANP